MSHLSDYHVVLEAELSWAPKSYQPPQHHLCHNCSEKEMKDSTNQLPYYHNSSFVAYNGGTLGSHLEMYEETEYDAALQMSRMEIVDLTLHVLNSAGRVLPLYPAISIEAHSEPPHACWLWRDGNGDHRKWVISCTTRAPRALLIPWHFPEFKLASKLRHIISAGKLPYVPFGG
ncbi:hypothetical protein Cni_G05590 [Canna indica]|uniref:Uncharacterized protein n=1 Tax=Canna indica TaxID=4628 RepID=A0AAQ3JVF4_9LILI|nr:hypothetical protein Cni_G05590 [Canna indica]